MCVCVGLQSVRCRSGVDEGVCRAATAALTALQYKQRAVALNKNNDARQSTGLHRLYAAVRRMNQVNARRARLLPGWVTVFGRVYHLGM